MSRLMYYWDRTKTTMTWEIAYRNRNGKTILSDNEAPFHVINLEKRTWGADPILFEHNGETFLFYELFLEKKNKGVIACSNIETGVFDTTEIIIEEDFHMSFPCVFELNKEVYMIPETGSQHKLILYRCIDFPKRWMKDKILLEGVDSSDTIIHQNDGEIYVIASFLMGNPSTAKNTIYKLCSDTLELSYLYEESNWGNRGYRNAGYIFSENGTLFRPGQNCEDNQYGKSLLFWKIDQFDGNGFLEKQYREISVNDLNISNSKEYQGIHTYTKSDQYEVIDLKIISKNSITKRVKLFIQVLFSYFRNKF